MAAANSFQELQKWTRAGLVYAITQHEVSIDLTSKVNKYTNNLSPVVWAVSCAGTPACNRALTAMHNWFSLVGSNQHGARDTCISPDTVCDWITKQYMIQYKKPNHRETSINRGVEELLIITDVSTTTTEYYCLVCLLAPVSRKSRNFSGDITLFITSK